MNPNDQGHMNPEHGATHPMPPPPPTPPGAQDPDPPQEATVEPAEASMPPPGQPAAHVFSAAPVAPEQSTPPVSFGAAAAAEEDVETVRPMAVVQVLSPRGVEYVLMTLSLAFSAIGLITVLVSLINGSAGFEVLAFPLSMLLVSLPLFALFFLRLKKAELANPALRLDPSKRRSTQVVQVITFLVSLFTLMGIIYTVFMAVSGESESIGKALGTSFVILLVTGGIFAYYWYDEHKSR